MRAIWSGSIGFGLVNIPVKMYSATEEERLELDMLDKRDESNIKYTRINEKTGKEVKWTDIVKGFKYNDDYVVLTDKDFEMVSPKKSQMIEIEEFAEEAVIDPSYFEKPYYLAPAKGGEKAYALLREALKDSGKMAVGTWVMRNRERVCGLRAVDNVIMLMRMRFADELRDYSELGISDDISVSAKELKMAQSLIDQMTPKEFSLDKYKDTYTNALKKLVEKKAKGTKIKAPAIKMVRSKTADLMSQLKASLEGQKKAS